MVVAPFLEGRERSRAQEKFIELMAQGGQEECQRTMRSLLDLGIWEEEPPKNSYGIQTTKETLSGLLYASIRKGDPLGKIHLILESGVDIHRCSWGQHEDTLITAAAKHGRMDIIALLVGFGCDIEETHPNVKTTALQLVLLSGRETTQQEVSHLLSLGADINGRGKCSGESGEGRGLPPFLIACATDDIALVRFMMERGADIRATNDTGENALHISGQDPRFGNAHHIHIQGRSRDPDKGAEITALLLLNGVDPNNFGENLKSPFLMATFDSSLQNAALLFLAMDEQSLAHPMHSPFEIVKYLMRWGWSCPSHPDLRAFWDAIYTRLPDFWTKKLPDGRSFFDMIIDLAKTKRHPYHQRKASLYPLDPHPRGRVHAADLKKGAGSRPQSQPPLMTALRIPSTL